MTVPIIVFAVFFLGIYSAYWAFVLRPEQQAAGLVRKRLKQGARAGRQSALALLRKSESLSDVPGFDAVLRHIQPVTGRLQALLHQSGVRMTPGGLVAICLGVALAAGLLATSLTGWISAGLVAACVAAPVPIFVLRFRRTRRLRKFEEQLPEALDLLARALRAGHAFKTGIGMVAEELPDPIGPEFKLLHDQQNYGMPMAEAMRDFASRIPVIDARFFATAVLIQRESGGNLSEILDNLSTVIRERFRVKRQMRVISAHGRITGWILVALPPVMFVVMMLINDEHRRTMFGHPLGIQMLIGAGVLQVIGTLVIRKIVNVEY